MWRACIRVADDSLLVAVVCSGNRFRSPLTEALLVARLAPETARVASCGTLDVAGAAPLPEAISLGVRLGVDLSCHRARTLKAGQLAAADLVIGFEPHHVDIARRRGGARPEIVFTLTELVELLEATRGDTPREHVQAAHDERERHAGRDVAPIVEDPYGQPFPVHADVAARIDQLVTRLVSALVPTARAAGE
jgi:protein-tyrosine-phosphatase